MLPARIVAPMPLDPGARARRCRPSSRNLRALLAGVVAISLAGCPEERPGVAREIPPQRVPPAMPLEPQPAPAASPRRPDGAATARPPEEGAARAPSAPPPATGRGEAR